MIEESKKPKAIENIGVILTTISILIIFGNGSGALIWSLIGLGEELNKETLDNEAPKAIQYLFANYITICLSMVSIGALYLIGSIFFKKYKLWANHMISIISLVLILLIWAIMIVFFLSIPNEEVLFRYGCIANAILWSTPLGLLVRYINKKEIKKHFT